MLRQFAQETGGRAFFPDQLADLANVYGQISDELSSQYTIGYTPRNPRRDGAWRRIVVRVDRPNATARTKQGYFGPTTTIEDCLPEMNFAPLALYGVALVAYVWHFARRDPAVGRAATTLLVAAALAHTFVIGMQTMEVGPRADRRGRPRPSRRSCGCSRCPTSTPR